MPEPVLASYIVSTTRNTAIDHLKRQIAFDTNVSSLDDESFSAHLESQLPPLDDQMEAEELREQLAAVLDKIPNDDRILLEGKYILQYSDAVLAKMLHCKVSSIRMKLTRARRRALTMIKMGGEKVQ